MFVPLVAFVCFYIGLRIIRKEGRVLSAILFALALYILISLAVLWGREWIFDNTPLDVQFPTAIVLMVFLSGFHVFLIPGLLCISVALFIVGKSSLPPPPPPSPNQVSPKRSHLWRYAIMLIASIAISVYCYQKYVETPSNYIGASSAVMESLPVPYYYIDYVSEVGDTLAYVGGNVGENFFVHDGEEIPWPHGNIIDVVDTVSGRPLFRANEQNVRSLLYYNGIEYGREYENVRSAVEIDNEVAFQAVVADKQIIVYRNQEYGKEYDVLHGPFAVDTKLGFYGVKDGKSEFIVDNQVVAKYPGTASFKMVDDEILVVDEIVNSRDEKLLIYKGQTYKNVYDYAVIDGELAYITKRENQSVLVYNGQEFVGNIVNLWKGGSLGDDNRIVVIDDKIGYVLLDEVDGTQQMWIQGESYSKKYKEITHVVVSPQGRIAMRVLDGETYKIILDNQEIYNWQAGPPKFIGEHIAFEGKNGGDELVYYRDGLIELPRSVDYVNGLTEVGGKLVVWGKLKGRDVGNRHFILQEK